MRAGGDPDFMPIAHGRPQAASCSAAGIAKRFQRGSEHGAGLPGGCRVPAVLLLAAGAGWQRTACTDPGCGEPVPSGCVWWGRAAFFPFQVGHLLCVSLPPVLFPVLPLHPC